MSSSDYSYYVVYSSLFSVDPLSSLEFVSVVISAELSTDVSLIDATSVIIPADAASKHLIDLI
jgi:hypothetical protein